MRKKIAIIAQQGGIVPAINGGAVETLLEMLVEENEIKKKLEIFLFVSKDDQAEKLSKKYSHTNFIFIKINFFEKVFWKIYRIFIKLFKINKYEIQDAFINRSVEKIKSLTMIDAVVVEEGEQIDGYRILKRYFPGKVFYHSHLHEIPLNNILHDHIITTSKFCKTEWLKYLPENKIDVLYNGVDLQKFHRQITSIEQHELREKLGISDDDFVVLYCGRIIPVKGVYELVQAISKIDDSKIKLMLVGGSNFAKSKRTPYLDKIQKVIEKYPERFILTGYVPYENLYKYYQSTDLQVVPSLWEEAAGLVTIEGMMSGLPLVVTQSGGMPEYVSEDCAMVVPKNDQVVDVLINAIVKLKMDPKLRHQMGCEGKKRASLFSKEAYYMNFVKLFNER